MGVVDKSGHFLTARGLNAAQRRERLFKVVRLGAVGVDNEQEVKILRVQLVNEARQHMCADGVAADVDDARPALVLKQRQDRRSIAGISTAPPQELTITRMPASRRRSACS